MISLSGFDESMLDCCEKLEIIKLKGLTLSKISCLARCQGASSILKVSSSVTVEEFRDDVKRVTSQGLDEPHREVIIASYYRPVLHQTGSGHFSPIGGYNSASDMVLIMDVARFKYPPHWVPLTLLFEAMNTVDKDSGKARGYVLISRPIAAMKSSSCEGICQLEDDENYEKAEVTQMKEGLTMITTHSCDNCR